MSLKLVLLSGCALATGLAALVGLWQSADKKPVVIRQQFQGWRLEFINNSPTMSQVLGMNSSGSIVGVKEHETDMHHVYFFCDQNVCQEMPIPKGFTNVEAAAISDTDLVVGRTTKAIGTPGSLQAVVWAPKQSEIKMLPAPQADGLTDACDIAADGKRITGYATGHERLRPVVWEWDDKKTAWQVEVLPTEHAYNPYLMSSQLVISPDGKTIAGCCTEGYLPDGSLDSALYAWSKADGKWTRKLVTAEQMYVKGINNKGEIVGSVYGAQGRQPCLVSMDGKVTALELLEGDVSGEARDINEQSVIVGWSDDPTGPTGSPTPCTWSVNGKATQVKVSELEFGMLFAINAKGQIAGTAGVVTKAATSDKANDEESAMLAVIITKDK